MAFNDAAVRKHLKAFAFTELFVEDLGWDRRPLSLPLDVAGQRYELHSPVHKAGLHVFLCPPAPGGVVPDYPTRRKIERQVAKSFVEHLIIFTDAAKTTQIWQWMKREKDKPVVSREHTFHVANPGPLIQKLQKLQFTLDEEEQGVSIVHSSGRARDAFDVEKVTKKFFKAFEVEHRAFLDKIAGFPAAVGKDPKTKKPIPHGDHQWYTSLTLNRLMFVYFIQKKRFLDGDPDYLQHRLAAVKQIKGDGKFHSFYRLFLLHLFHDGLGKQKDERKDALDAELLKLIGDVPYLNGGFFEVHQLERDYPDIDIPDKAFKRLFEFFDGWDWVLDTRIPRDLSNSSERKDEINPDVVGYIFEKFINQKQMGAYYTKEDITGYITQNTILPFILDAAAKECAVAFQPDGSVWKLLKDDPDRYIYEPVRRGVFDAAGKVIPLPPEIDAGIADIPRRAGWNKPATAPFALPTETWREHVARRQRCVDLRETLQNGEIHTVSDLVTHNLDIRQFAQDIITNADGPELLRALWQPLRDVTVLDPTCGSGAFLFAALNLLEPLYSGCLDKMQALLDEAERLNDFKRLARLDDFAKTLAAIAKHANEDYFVLKSIIVNNLYGVDIMEEAVEICRLRLFLKLVSTVSEAKAIEPLPDIDFNVRAGNTLVGYATRDQSEDNLNFGNALVRIDAKAQNMELQWQKFKAAQSEVGYSAEFVRAIKAAILKPLGELRVELDGLLSVAYGQTGANKLPAFRKSHQPFHWWVEFYGIMKSGGFDVIVGNPPYVATSKVRKDYTVLGYVTERCTDIYAWCIERSSQIINENGYTGMIVPLSIGFSGDFAPLRSLLDKTYRGNWFSSFGRIPAALFAADVRVRNTIHIGSKQHSIGSFTTRLHRWFESERATLLHLLSYASFNPARWKGRIPKLNTSRLIQAFEENAAKNVSLNDILAIRETKHRLHFKKTAYNWLNFCRKMPPCFDEFGKAIEHTKFGECYFNTLDDAAIASLLLNGKIQMAFWIALGDDFDVTKWMFADLPVDFKRLNPNDKSAFVELAGELQLAMKEATSFKLNAGKRVGNYNLAKCRHVTDKSDRMLARSLGFDEVWEDVQLLYTQFVRTDFSGINADEELD